MLFNLKVLTLVWGALAAKRKFGIVSSSLLAPITDIWLRIVDSQVEGPLSAFYDKTWNQYRESSTVSH